MPQPEPWSPAVATQQIRRKADEHLTLSYTRHAKCRLKQRDLVVGDVLHVLRYGTVHEVAEPASRGGLFKYRIECSTPNSNRRSVRLVVIPSPNSSTVKVVTVMWVDGN